MCEALDLMPLLYKFVLVLFGLISFSILSSLFK